MLFGFITTLVVSQLVSYVDIKISAYKKYKVIPELLLEIFLDTLIFTITVKVSPFWLFHFCTHSASALWWESGAEGNANGKSRLTEPSIFLTSLQLSANWLKFVTENFTFSSWQQTLIYKKSFTKLTLRSCFPF